MNRQLILSKYILYIILLLGCPVFAQQQKAVDATWKQLQRENGFRKGDSYSGPREGYVQPADMKDADVQYQQNTYNGLPYNSNQIQRSRRQGQNATTVPGGNGPGQGGPTQAPTVAPVPPDIPDVDAPDIDTPDIDPPDVDLSFSKNFWQYLLLILLIIAVGLVIYLVIKNRQAEPKTKFTELSDDVNPILIPKSELELRLEAAVAEGNYKECVRIYFLFGLRELITRQLIFWRKDKTNIHYAVELSGKPGEDSFSKMASVYELVWYGDYAVDSRSWHFLERDLKNVYSNLSSLP